MTSIYVSYSSVGPWIAPSDWDWVGFLASGIQAMSASLPHVLLGGWYQRSSAYWGLFFRQMAGLRESNQTYLSSSLISLCNHAETSFLSCDLSSFSSFDTNWPCPAEEHLDSHTSLSLVHPPPPPPPPRNRQALRTMRFWWTSRSVMKKA